MNYWLLKSEPTCYWFDDLENDGSTDWDGVRNYQARNNLLAMKKGDLAFLYHSVGPREIVGVVEITTPARFWLRFGKLCWDQPCTYRL